MQKEIIRIDSLPDPEASFSRALKIDNWQDYSLVFISGTASVGPQKQTMFAGDFSRQVRYTYQNIKNILAKTGADLKDVVEYQIYLKDMAYYEEFNQLRREIFAENGITKDFPASTCVQAKLCREDLLVEINAKALVKSR